MESLESSLDLEQYWLIFKRRFPYAFATFMSIFAVSIVHLSNKEPIYMAQGKILLEKASSTSYLTEAGQEIANRDALGEDSNPLNTEIEIITSNAVLEKTVTQLEKQHNIFISHKEIKEKLTIQIISDTDILQLSYQNTVPQQAAAVVNTLIDIYLQKNLLLQRTEAVAVRYFLEEQIPESQANILQAEDALRRFKENNQVISIQGEAESLAKLTQELQSKITITQAEIASISTQFTTLQNQLGISLDQAIATTSLSQSAEVQRLREELQQVESELAVQQTIFTEADPTIIDLKSKMGALKNLLKQQENQVLGAQGQGLNRNLKTGKLQQDITAELIKLEAQQLSLNNQLAQLYETQAFYEQRARRLSRLEQQQAKLNRQLEDAKLNYSLLLPKLQEIRIVENQNIGNARIISQAQIPETPIFSSKIYYLASSILAFMTAIAVVCLLEVTDKSIRTVNQAEKIFGFPVLATIPLIKKSNRNQYFINQVYRILHTKLDVVSLEKNVITIMITSSVPQEGKSEISSNVALIMAQAGYRVLLLDMNTYEPMQHHIWKLESTVDLSQIITGKVDFHRYVKNVRSNLDVLISRKNNEYAITDINSQQIISFINQLSKDYDLIIIDTPSLKTSIDAQTLSKMVDRVIFVVRLKFIDSASALFYKQLLEPFNHKVIGQVVNGINLNQHPLVKLRKLK